MPSHVLHLAGVAAAVVVVASALAGPAAAAAEGPYPATIRAISGAVAIAGSMGMAGAIGRTLLRSGGNAAFKAAYVAAAALGGLGAAETLSAVAPLDIGPALAAYCAASIVAGAGWVRFHGRAA